MGQASVVTRMRTGDIRSVPLAFWLFAILTLAYAYLLVTERPIEAPSDVLSLLSVLAPLLFATAIAWANPVDLRYLWGAAFIAGSDIEQLVELALTRFANFDFNWGAGVSPSSFTWGLELIGAALIALAIGGIHERRNWLWPVLGLAIFIIGDVENGFFWVNFGGPLEEVGQSPLLVAMSFVGGLTVLTWSYLLGAAIEHRRWLFAIGSGIFVAFSAFNLVDEMVFGLFPPPAEGGTSILYWPLVITSMLGWVAMIAAALREVPRRGRPDDAALEAAT